MIGYANPSSVIYIHVVNFSRLDYPPTYDVDEVEDVGEVPSPDTGSFQTKLHCKEGCYTFHTLVRVSTTNPEFPDVFLSARTLFDTGSDVEIISNLFVERFGLTAFIAPSPTPRPLYGFGGARAWTTGDVHLKWYFDFNSSPQIVTFSLVDRPEDDFDILLGGQFLHKNRILVVSDGLHLNTTIPQVRVRMLKGMRRMFGGMFLFLISSSRADNK
jgi:hypothetical protein